MTTPQIPSVVESDAVVRERILLRFGSREDPWKVRDAVEGVQIFGATGSGKTSGSGEALAEAFLDPKRGNFGGLVLTAKPDELDNWKKYMKRVGRDDDLVVFGPGEKHQFNFLEYEYNRGDAGGRLTHNVVSLFLAALSAGDAASHGDPYWNDALRELLTHAVDLAVLGTREPSGRSRLSLLDLMRIIRTAPQDRVQASSPAWRKHSRCWELIADANIRSIENRLAESDLENAARRVDLQETIDYWLNDFPSLADRTRSVIVSSFTSKAAGLLRSPLRELFCSDTMSDDSGVFPERTHTGKVLVLNLPVKVYGEVGRFAQVLYKTIWQGATERRGLSGDWRPVFLWADESQYFVTSEDMLFQQTARSKMAATVYLTQNLPNYYAMLGGRNGNASTESLLGNLQTKIFHTNGDPATNEWGERVFGKHWKLVEGQSSNIGGHAGTSSSSIGMSVGEQLVPVIEAIRFTTLARGGPPDNRVSAIIFQAGRHWSGKKNFVEHSFSQKQPS